MTIRVSSDRKRKNLPRDVVEKYASCAMHKARTCGYMDGTWYAWIPGFSGLRAMGTSEKGSLKNLEQRTRIWTQEKWQRREKLPVLNGINLND